MAYHFPLMPRMYMAIAQEDRHPIVEIMEQTPDIPDDCQWAIFLRNHDELTLEMVTSRERDYMYQMYAADPRARLNLGIRRRLAPLMENDPERIKLMNSLLLSMPGSPIIYYGDEIGMGDNVYLGDRNGVRTPMQWSPDRNAGFSRADPQQLYLPPIMDPIYGYEAVNVEAQRRDRSSLLNWMKRMLQVRKTSQAFGRGTLQVHQAGQSQGAGVPARARRRYDPVRRQPVALGAAGRARSVAIQGRGADRTARPHAVSADRRSAVFPDVAELRFLLVQAESRRPAARMARRAPAARRPACARAHRRLEEPVSGAGRQPGARVRHRSFALQLEERVLPRFIAAQRWYRRQRRRRSPRVELVEQGEMAGSAGTWFMALFDVETAAAATPYFLPLSIVYEGAEEARWSKAAGRRHRASAAAGHGRRARGSLRRREVLPCADRGNGAGGELAAGARARCISGRRQAYAELRGDPADSLATSPPRNQGSNTTLRVGERLFLKIYRRLQNGVNPEVEIGRLLTEIAHFPQHRAAGRRSRIPRQRRQRPTRWRCCRRS